LKAEKLARLKTPGKRKKFKERGALVKIASNRSRHGKRREKKTEFSPERSETHEKRKVTEKF